MANHPDLFPAATRHSDRVSLDTGAQAADTTMVVNSETLLQGQRELLIRHQGYVYRLQATRQGKLILTK